MMPDPADILLALLLVRQLRAVIRVTRDVYC